MVAHTLHNFGDGVEAMPAYLGMMEFNPCKCAMAATEGIPGLQLRLCCHLENPWHWVPAADSVPYLGLQLQPDGEFSLQLKHRLRRAVVQHWCLNTLAPPNVVQDVILVILAGWPSTLPSSSLRTQTPRIPWTTSRICRGGVPRRWSSGRGCHLRRRLCVGWGCSGGAFLQR